MARTLTTLVRDFAARQEVRVHRDVLRDLGPGWEDPVAAAFLARMEQRIDRIVDRRVEERLKAARLHRGSTVRLVLCLVFAIPLAFVAGQFAGLEGILAVLGVILLLNWEMLIPG